MSDFKGIGEPYYFRPLYEGYRKIIDLCGSWEDEYIPGSILMDLAYNHDMLRQLCSWNFISVSSDDTFKDNEAGVSILDFQIPYKITSQTREFVALELNNISDLDRAILVLLRADHAPEMRSGLYVSPTFKTIGFYELVMILGKSEFSVNSALSRLKQKGLVSSEGELVITDAGLEYIDKGDKAVMFNNINISNNSTVGVVALHSTLTNIDTNIGILEDNNNKEISSALSELTESISSLDLAEKNKIEALEQIEVISEEATKISSERKTNYVKGALAFLDKVQTTAENFKEVWIKAEPIIRTFFGL